MPKDARFRYLLILLFTYLVLGLLTRLVIGLVFQPAGAETPAAWGGVLVLGGLNDLASFVYAAAPLAALVLLPPWGARGLAITAGALFSLSLGLGLFTAAAEYFFWEEFGARFNFIAVDYLIYTTELIRNIIESYPLGLILAGTLALALALTGLIWKAAFPAGFRFSPGARPRPVWAAWLAVLAALQLFYTPPAPWANNLMNELSFNGVYNLVAAYRHNQLDYRQFYPTMNQGEALSLLRRELDAPDARWDLRPESLVRRVRAGRAERRLNVIQIVVESLGRDLLGPDTPNLTALIGQSLYFENLRATGTRTVRGIEALTLGLPPTPGSSIVRRPGNDDLFNIGRVFQEKGYETTFVYGGFGYFDNMNAFFAGNGFDILDRYALPGSEITFANAWGVCDEDLYRAALKKADQSFRENRPFYQFVLTTSNHRPFTYPDGKVEIPSGRGRKGAVQYTDYALGQFLREAQARPWFSETVFVIVADHTTGAAGKTVIPPERYLIPALIYSPGRVAPGRVAALCSQMDLPPTILALLGFSYDNAFFGRDILSLKPEEGRAYLSTYQLLGLLTPAELIILAPNQAPRAHAQLDPPSLQRAIAAYQSAQDFFVDGRLKNDFRAAFQAPR